MLLIPPPTVELAPDAVLRVPPPIIEQAPVVIFLKPPPIVENLPALQQVIVPVKSPVVAFSVPPLLL